MTPLDIETARALLNTFGLTLDIGGILLLLRFGIDRNKDIRPGATPLIWTAGDDPVAAKKNDQRYALYVRWTNRAYIMIVLGFSFQIVAIWVADLMNWLDQITVLAESKHIQAIG